MDKGYPPQESAPPYPGPPLNYGGAVPQGGMYPQPGMQPQPGMYPQHGPVGPPPVGYQGGFAPAQPVPLTTVTHVMVNPTLHDVPGQTVCPHCQQTVITTTEPTAGLLTWLICGGLAFVGCFLCSCIPFCVESCQDIHHRCPSCHRTIYIHRRM